MNDIWQINQLLEIFINNGYEDKALPYLNKLANSKEFLQSNGQNITQHYLHIGDIEMAKTVAKMMSKAPDNYSQQKSLILVADWYIKNSEISKALEILDFAYQKANKITYVHLGHDSIGASAGSRKEIYLRDIYQQLMKLKQYDKAYKVINSIGSEQDDAKEFLAEQLIDFASQQAGSLSRKQIENILIQAQKLVDENSDYFELRIKLLLADVYVKLGDNNKAIDLIAEALTMANESCCYQDDILLEAGKIFDSNNLKTNPKLKKALHLIIKEELS